jgi:hypothetical protein
MSSFDSTPPATAALDTREGEIARAVERVRPLVEGILARTARTKRLSPEDADDVQALVMLRIVRRLQLGDVDDLRAYTATLTRNALHDLVRIRHPEWARMKNRLRFLQAERRIAELQTIEPSRGSAALSVAEVKLAGHHPRAALLLVEEVLGEMTDRYGDVVWSAHTVRARALLQLGRRADAKQALREAVRILERQRHDLPADVSAREHFFATRAEPYHRLIALLAADGRVDSAATERLMIAFHRALAAGVAPPEALRHAALSLRAEPAFAHPFYWAPFVVIGNGR